MTDDDHTLIKGVADQLHTYAQVDGSEVGEVCLGLIYLTRYLPFIFGAGFVEALHTELKDQLENYQEYATLVETEEVIKRTVVSLEWE